MSDTSAAQTRTALVKQALTVAQRWLANSMPAVELDGPKPLPLIAEALAALDASPPSLPTAREVLDPHTLRVVQDKWNGSRGISRFAGGLAFQEWLVAALSSQGPPT